MGNRTWAEEALGEHFPTSHNRGKEEEERERRERVLLMRRKRRLTN